MPELRGDVGDRRFPAKQMARHTVPQIVQLVPTDSGLFHRASEALPELRVVHWASAGAGNEDPFRHFAPLFFQRLPFACRVQRAQHGSQVARHVDGPDAARLGSPQLARGERALDQDLAVREV